MLAWWGPVIWETYGGTEGAATIAKPHRWLEKPGTVGRPVRGMRVNILDDDGREVPSGTVGDVYMERVDGQRFEYRNDAELTESVHRGTAFTIGDVGYLDEDGYLFIWDRAKDMIIAFCRQRLAEFKCPRTVDFDPALPRTATGKLMKRQIRQTFWAEAGRSV